MFRRFGKTDRTAVDALIAQARDLLALDDDACISINEIACGHAVCGDIETIVLLMRPQTKTRSFCIKKRLSEITRDDLAAVLTAAP